MLPERNRAQVQQNARYGSNAFITPDMSVEEKVALFGAAAAVRLLLFTVFPALPTLLDGRVEVSTPVTSFKRCMLDQGQVSING